MKRSVRLLATILILFTFSIQAAAFGGLALAASSGTTIDMADSSPPASGTGWTYAGGVYTILNGADVTVIGTNANGRRIAVAANATATITLDGVTIKDLGSNQSALLLNNNAKVTLKLAEGSNNTLVAGNNCAGIQTTGATLTITGKGSLAATGGNNGAGIGGGNHEAGGNITIGGSVKVTATGGGNNDAGIGGGNNGASGNIKIIDDASVTAYGGHNAAGIGSSGGGAVNSILIKTNGNVIATGGGTSIGHGSPHSLGFIITTQPSDKTVEEGEDVIFSVNVSFTPSGTPPYNICWQVSKDDGHSWTNLSDGHDVSGAETTTLELKNVKADMNGNLYRCVLTDKETGEAITIYSHEAMLRLEKTYDLNVTAAEGGSVFGTPSGRYAKDTPISVTAAADPGYHFTGWTIKGATITGGDKSNPATFKMPDNEVHLKANFARNEPGTHTLTVLTGTGGTVLGTPSGSYEKDTPISVVAIANPGHEFAGWTISGAAIMGGNNANPATFDMPDNAVTLKANFVEKQPEMFSLKVIKGTGSGMYEKDAQVQIKADKAPSGYVFDKWVLEGNAELKNAKSATTMVTMIDSDVTVTATYRRAGSDPPQTGDGSNIALWVAAGLLSSLCAVGFLTRKKWLKFKSK